MIRSTLVLAAGCLGLHGPALAQSTVSLFGTVDLNLTFAKSGGRSVRAMDQGGNVLPSRLGFRGTEDLGGGLAASFWLEAATLPDTGEFQGVGWQRRSTVSLSHNSFGELRLGRDYTPSFWNVSQFSPFGTVGVGGSSNIVEGWPFGLGGAKTLVRANNSVGYFLPRNLGGFYGQVMVAMPEGQEGMKYSGARLGYASGPLDIAASYGQTPVEGRRYRNASLGGSYDFGVVKLYANYLRQKNAPESQTHAMLGLSVPVGAGVIKASVARANRSGPGVDADDATQVALGYVHWLSKRTAVYGTWSVVRNKGNAAYVVTDALSDPQAGANSRGLQFGISHNF
ncbi:porin [Variovorax sp. J22G73]|uniref:porin n=1 Tax=unclassified Variovorax TaxID=663243 RepID=UPI0025789190|nr:MULTISPECIES: porin [unclassified Variovorax]MDM0005356.1 porin [Variovorax sp. J22R203]MDM0098772.1 porin [Variovorax sp. J22G73]